VIATTSSDAKASRLQELGAHHIINYRTQPGWGSVAKRLTPEGRGVDYIVDVGGPTTLGEAIQAVRLDGLIVATGMVAGMREVGPEAMSALWKLYVMRGVLLGSKDMLWEMIKWFEEKSVKPALDDVAFALSDAKEAYDRLEKQKHFSKVVIRID
jgi:NADPH:quinone reductase-like Zn-dependent oxidoreductase